MFLKDKSACLVLNQIVQISYKCIVTINVLWLFLKVSWVGLQCVIVVVPDYTHLLFTYSS